MHFVILFLIFKFQAFRKVIKSKYSKSIHIPPYSNSAIVNVLPLYQLFSLCAHVCVCACVLYVF